MSVHISVTNSKLGSSIPSVNLPPCDTCSPDAPCAGTCYARKGNFRFSNVQKSMRENYLAYLRSPSEYEDAIVAAASNFTFFRFHSAGDIPDADYFQMMIRIAKRCPNTKFLVFTKKFNIVNNWLIAEGALPANLTVVFSAWGDAHLPKNPFALPVAYVRLKNKACTIPEDAHECPGFCGSCASTDHSCWNLKRSESVVFNQH